MGKELAAPAKTRIAGPPANIQISVTEHKTGAMRRYRGDY
jgi:hypothetical protein